MKFIYSVLSFVLLASQASAAPVTTCVEQESTFTWEINTLKGSDIQCTSLGDCVVEVCMNVDSSLSTIKDGGAISHMCDASDVYGCVWEKDHTGAAVPYPYFDATDAFEADGECNGLTIGTGPDSIKAGMDNSKCGGVTKLKLCQEGKPGDTLWFIMKDGKLNTKDDPVPKDTYATTVDFFTPTDASCSAALTCGNYKYTCGNKDEDDPQASMERSWGFTIPASCDYGCGAEPVDPAPAPVDPAPAPVDPAPVDPAPVDPAPVPAPVEPESTPVDPSSPSGSQGDPHFKTWKNEHFEYHGQCDMVLAKDPTFAGVGLDVQIRTKLVRFWSYIKQTAVRIGDDILEVEGSVDGAARYWMNLQQGGELKTLGGFPVSLEQRGNTKSTFTIDLSSKYPGQSITISTYKEFVRIDLSTGSEEAFGNCVGLLGDFKSGKTLARDGREINDFVELGNEWQVLPVEHMLFHDISEPQFPKKCIEPEDPRGERRRRLAEATISEEQAEKACASIKDALDRKDCVYDILATQDLDMVGAY